MTTETRTPLSVLAAQCRMYDGMYKGTFWRHNASAAIYEVTGVAIDEATGEPRIEYRPHINCDPEDACLGERIDGLKFSRPRSEWLEMVGTDEMPIPRFSRVKPSTVFVSA